MAMTETRGPAQFQYEAVKPDQVGTVVACGQNYTIIDQPEASHAIATQLPVLGSGGGDFAGWLQAKLDEGRGIVLQLPSFQGLPAAAIPPRQGIELYCQPDPTFSMTVLGFASDSLNEVRHFVSTGRGIVLREPVGGWLELRQGGLKLGWLPLAAAGVAVLALGYMVFSE
jgi:hypothetical protein